MSRIAMRGPVTILHVSQPTDGGVGKYIVDAVADQVRRGWRVLVASPSYDDLPSRVEAAGARHVEWTASRAPGPGSLLDTLRIARRSEEHTSELQSLCVISYA